MATNPAHNMSLEEMDRRSVLHPFTDLEGFANGTAPERVVRTGQGVRIRDDAGTELIDAFAGLYCVNVGYGRREIADAIHRQALELAYYHAYAGHSTEAVIRLSDRILRQAPGAMSKVFYGLSGSDANETQVKIVWYYNNVLGRPEKKKIISRLRGYHGASIMSGSLTGLPFYHKAFDLPVRPVRHTSTPHWYWHHEEGEDEKAFSARCAEELEAMIREEGPETVAAFIAEPVLGTGGIIPPPDGYWEAIAPVLKRHDILLIADEVVCGFGRVGAAFGSTLYGLEPDLMTVAKGLTSAYAPLSGTLVNDKVFAVLEQGSAKFGPFSHGYTYSAHPIGAAAAMANLDIVEGEDLAGNARDVGGYLLSRLHEALDDHPLVAEVRGVGMLAAVEFAADRVARKPFDPALKVGARVSAEALSRGLIARAMPNGDILGFAPPLVLTRDDADRIVDIAKASVDAVTEALVRDGVRLAG
ncbi:MAG: aminotransferase [Azospirillaceae bacterium]